MFVQLMINANDQGIATPAQLTAYDADTLTDPITDAKYRGPFRRVELAADAAQRICDAVNAELGGAAKFTARTAEARTKEQTKRAALEAAELMKEK